MSELDVQVGETNNDYLKQLEDRQFSDARQRMISEFGFDPFSPLEQLPAKAEPKITKQDPLAAMRSAATELPTTQIAGGVRDAVAETLNIASDVQDFFTGVETKGIGDFIPEIPDSDSTTLGIARSGAQFLTDFAPAMVALKGVKFGIKGTKLALGVRAEVSGAAAAASAFDPDDPNLSNLINDLIPAIRNPVTEYLATNPDDKAAENRFKNALEGLGLGAMTEGLFGVFRAIRSAKGIFKGKEGLEAELKEGIRKDVEAKVKLPEIEVLESGRKLTKEETIGEVAGDIPELTFTGKETQEQINAKIKEFQGLIRKRLKAKRGKRPLPTSQQAADLLGLTPDDIKAFKEGDIVNAETIIAIADIVKIELDNMVALATQIMKGEGGDEAVRAFLQKADLIGVLDPKLFGLRGEQGRALQANVLVKPTIKRLERITEEFAKRTGGEVTPKQFAGMFLNLMKETKPKDASKFLRILKRTPGMITEAWLSGLLSGIKTHEINFLGNLSTLFMAPLERGVAARLPMSSVAKGEATAMLYGMVMAFGEALRLAGRTLKTGIAADAGIVRSTKLEGFSTRKISSEAFELEKTGIAGRAVDWLGAGITFPLRALLASDTFFKTINRSAELHALSLREAMNQNLRGAEAGRFMREFVADPDPSVIRQAEDFAAYQTFTNDLGRFGDAVQNFANAHMFVKFFLPFVRTPINIFKYSYERTPVGALHLSIQKSITKGGVEANLAISRLALTSMASGVFAAAAAAGNITGKGPQNKEMRKIMRENGWQPNSIMVNGTYVNYNRADPLGQMVGDIADFVEASQYLDYKTAEGIALGIVIAYSKNAMSKTYVTGMRNLMDIIMVGASTGELGQAFSAARAAGRKFSLSFIPTIAKDVARGFDPVLREADSYSKAWHANIPYFSKSAFAERNVFGEVVVRNSTLTEIINPLYITHDKNDIVMEELIKREALIPQIPNWIGGTKPSFGFQQPRIGEGIKLTDEQQDFWKVEAGKGARSEILDLMNSPDYKFNYSDFEKQQALISILREHREEGKEIMKDAFDLQPLIDKRVEQLEEARQVLTQ